MSTFRERLEAALEQDEFASFTERDLAMCVAGARAALLLLAEEHRRREAPKGKTHWVSADYIRSLAEELK